MAAEQIREVRGRAVLAQEDRFRLQTPDGHSFLFTLDGNQVPLPPDWLAALVDSGQMVRVLYRGEPEAGAVATAIESG